MKRAFVKLIAFLIDNAIWIVGVSFLISLAIGANNRVKADKLEAHQIEEIYEAISDVCELGGNVWSWEDKICYRPEHLRRIHKVKPASNGMI